MRRIILLNIFIALLWIASKVQFNWSIVEWINITFLFGLVFAIITACIKIWQSHFLDLFTNGFRMVGQFFMPIGKSRALNRADQQFSNDEGLKQFKQKTANFMFLFTSSLSGTSIIISVIALFVLY